MNKFKLFLVALGLICSAIGSKVLAMNDVTSKTPENNLNLNFDRSTSALKELQSFFDSTQNELYETENQLNKKIKLLEEAKIRLQLERTINSNLKKENESLEKLYKKKENQISEQIKLLQQQNSELSELQDQLSESNATITEKNKTLEAKTNQLKMAIGPTAGGATSSFLYIKTSLDNTRSSLVGAGVTGALNGLVLNKDRENGPKKALESAAISFVINYAINYFLLTEIKEAVAAQKLAAETITKQA